MTMVGPEQQPKLRFKGALVMNWVEGSCCFDPVAKKAYMFGGWSPDLYHTATHPESGRPQMLLGRYFNSLLEVDVEAMEIKV